MGVSRHAYRDLVATSATCCIERPHLAFYNSSFRCQGGTPRIQLLSTLRHQRPLSFQEANCRPGTEVGSSRSREPAVGPGQDLRSGQDDHVHGLDRQSAERLRAVRSPPRQSPVEDEDIAFRPQHSLHPSPVMVGPTLDDLVLDSGDSTQLQT